MRNPHMEFQDFSFNGLKVTVGTKSVTHPRTHAPKAICPINFFKVGGLIIISRTAKPLTQFFLEKAITWFCSNLYVQRLNFLKI